MSRLPLPSDSALLTRAFATQISPNRAPDLRRIGARASVKRRACFRVRLSGKAVTFRLSLKEKKRATLDLAD
jgi:hypothetical protein